MKITSKAFKHQEMIPKKYTCQGEDINPPLSIQDVPKEAKSLVLIVDDPDAPINPRAGGTGFTMLASSDAGMPVPGPDGPDGPVGPEF